MFCGFRCRTLSFVVSGLVVGGLVAVCGVSESDVQFLADRLRMVEKEIE